MVVAVPFCHLDDSELRDFMTHLQAREEGDLFAAGCGHASVGMGTCLLGDHGVAEDHERAFSPLSKAADAATRRIADDAAALLADA